VWEICLNHLEQNFLIGFSEAFEFNIHLDSVQNIFSDELLVIFMDGVWIAWFGLVSLLDCIVDCH
jgi:hypothetical protein